MSKKPAFRRSESLLRTVILAVALAACGAAQPLPANAQGDRGGMPGDFDYYVLALSWSPTYCSSHGGESGGDRDSGYDNDSGSRDEDRGYSGGRYGERRDHGRRGDAEQCGSARPYAFVLHGLWPQYERKGWPEFCESGTKPWVPAETIDRMMDIMPSRRLVIQEYKKHGVCSGLEPRQYFDAAREAYRSIRIPEEFQDLQRPLTVSPEDVRKAFLGVNRNLTGDMMQVACSRDLLREVRICFTKELTPRPCSRREQDRRLCTYSTVTMPPVRGGGTGPHGGPSYGSGDRL